MTPAVREECLLEEDCNRLRPGALEASNSKLKVQEKAQGTISEGGRASSGIQSRASGFIGPAAAPVWNEWMRFPAQSQAEDPKHAGEP